MMRPWTRALVAVASLATLACQSAPPGLSEQDKAAIRKVTEEAGPIATAAKPDFAAYVKHYYTEDATVLAANAPAAKGHAAIQAVLASFPPMTAFKAEILDIDGRGDVAYVRGNYAMTMNPPGAAAITDTGKYLEVWKKGADGSWKASYDSWTSDLPAAGLVVPTGAMAADASAEVKRLNAIVGRWQISGTTSSEPKGAPQPVAISLDCQWFASGTEVFCVYTGTLEGHPFQEADVYSYDGDKHAYPLFTVMHPGRVMSGTVTVGAGTWTHEWGMVADGKPARFHLVLTEMTPAGGKWKDEMSVAGGPWATVGEGTYSKAK
jgi:ketosteroid isomerase-like protein